ncbi:MAG: glycosyltransferase [Deltaproteobacteria bacterium]|nr:glycosyltransferase [Deltaproteobacteria bacterium]
MKIAFIVNSFPELSETFILDQITALMKLGHKIDVYSKIRPKPKKIHPDVIRYNLLDHTYYLKSMPTKKLVRLLGFIFLFFINLLKKPIITLRSINFIQFGNEALSLNLFYIALSFSTKKNYDIIHCHFGLNGITGALLTKLGVLTGKLVTSFHGYDANAISQEDFYTFLFKRGDVFTANSNFTKEKLIKLGTDSKKIHILPEGFYINKFSFREKKIYEGGKIVILSICRLVEKKGLEYSIRAIANVIPMHLDYEIEYRIVGDGPLRETLHCLITELKMNHWIKLLGWCDEKEIRKHYEDAHIFMLSSVTAENGDQEGQALVLQEAQASGLPVISTIHNGIPEGVLDGKSGFLVPEKDIKALTEKLSFLIKNHDLWPVMGRAGRNFVEQRYDINKLSLQLVKIYEYLLTQNVLEQK